MKNILVLIPAIFLFGCVSMTQIQKESPCMGESHCHMNSEMCKSHCQMTQSQCIDHCMLNDHCDM